MQKQINVLQTKQEQARQALLDKEELVKDEPVDKQEQLRKKIESGETKIGKPVGFDPLKKRRQDILLQLLKGFIGERPQL